MSERVQGVARETGGRVQQTVGEVIGDARTQASGLYNQAAGQAEQQIGRGRDVIKEQPLTAALVALGVGYLLGRLTA